MSEYTVQRLRGGFAIVWRDEAGKRRRFTLEAADRPTAEVFRERLARAIPNPFQRILELSDSLRLDLTADQKSRLQLMGDSLQVKADTLIGALAQTLGSNDARNSDALQLGARMRGRIQEGRALAQQAVKDAELILTPEQWAKIPSEVKQPFQAQQGQRRNRPPGG